LKIKPSKSRVIGPIMNIDAYTVCSALIVDDNQFNREIFRLSLKAVGYETTEACNGAEALALLETRSFSLIVLDLQMPLVNGETVLKCVRSNPAHARSNIIVATANPHMAVQDIQSLADYVVYKPMDVREFARLAERLKGRIHVGSVEPPP